MTEQVLQVIVAILVISATVYAYLRPLPLLRRTREAVARGETPEPGSNRRFARQAFVVAGLMMTALIVQGAYIVRLLGK